MNIALLGSTGSIGTQCTSVVDANRDKFNIYAIAAYNNVEVFQKQLDEYRPKYAAMVDEKAALKLNIPTGCKLFTGPEGVCKLAELDEVDAVLVAIVGIAGLDATYRAVKCNKRVALANKEALVTGGQLINDELKKNGAIIYPVDSEHSAIFQCLNGENIKNVGKLILTASGGAFRDYTQKELENAKPEDALIHPNWSMGRKITVDCATMMNKGLEVIEAHWLFGVPVENIQVVIHRESIVHSMVEYNDGAVIAQLGCPDMRLPIVYALSYPDRIDMKLNKLDFAKRMELSFYPPDNERFPCLNLAYDAIKIGDGMPTVLNAANEVAVQAFLDHQIGFCDISNCVKYAMDNSKNICINSIDDVKRIDADTRAICTKKFLMK